MLSEANPDLRSMLYSAPAAQNFTIDWRLGDGTKTGKIAARNAVTRQLQDYIIYNMSEMFGPIFSSPYGTTAANDGALTATVSVLQVCVGALAMHGAHG